MCVIYIFIQYGEHIECDNATQCEPHTCPTSRLKSPDQSVCGWLLYYYIPFFEILIYFDFKHLVQIKLYVEFINVKIKIISCFIFSYFLAYHIICLFICTISTSWVTLEITFRCSNITIYPSQWQRWLLYKIVTAQIFFKLSRL